MSTQHTPGPWRAEPWTCHAATSILADGNRLIADCAAIDGYSVNALPNARLIAAAPDLLTALKALFEQCSPEIPGSPGSPLELARAAIAKAEGQS